MMVSNKLVKYVLAVGFACVCVTSSVLTVFTFLSIGEACVYEITCNAWFVPLLILGMILLVAAAVSGYGLFILVRGVRARAA